MTSRFALFLDLGDAFTKAVVLRGVDARRFRYPSAVAYRLLDADGDAERTGLLLTDERKIFRPEGFDPSAFPRTRSYPGAKAFLDRARPERGARFAGKLATKYGADRQLLGTHPSHDNIDALVRKAFLLASPPPDVSRADVTLLIDQGPKASAIATYAEESPRHIHITSWKFGAKEPKRIDLEMHGKVVDSAACVVRALPTDLRPDELDRVLLIDIGYLRTKLTVLTQEGSAFQRVTDGLGVVDCTRRVLQDGQDQGLVEDEFAVIRALERSETFIEVAGRRFDVEEPLRAATRALTEELARISDQTIVADFARHAEGCRGVLIVGGGAALLGPSLASRIRSSFPNLRRVTALPDVWLPLEGAVGHPLTSPASARRATPSGNAE